jgi:hypothetical protein
LTISVAFAGLYFSSGLLIAAVLSAISATIAVPFAACLAYRAWVEKDLDETGKLLMRLRLPTPRDPEEVQVRLLTSAEARLTGSASVEAEQMMAAVRLCQAQPTDANILLLLNERNLQLAAVRRSNNSRRKGQ